MKKRTLSHLLMKLEGAGLNSGVDIVSLNDQLSKQMLKGGYVIANVECHAGSNSSCTNDACDGSRNGDCTNSSCLV